MTTVNKETQGHRKLKQYLEDLKRNRHFIKAIKKIVAILASKKNVKRDEKEEALMNDLLEKQQAINDAVKKALEHDKNTINEILHFLAEEYGIDFDLYLSIGIPEILGKEEIKIGDMYDFCQITDVYDENFNSVYPAVPLEFDTEKQLHTKAFPVSIDIHKFATKRDVLDFIEKRWDIIESYIDPYRNKKYRFRQRKLDRKITDFIWDKKGLSLKEIKQELDKQFPSNGLIYSEIGKIISIEKRRRFRKIV